MNEPRDVTPSWVEPMPGDLRTALSAKGDPDAIMRTIREAGYAVVPAESLARLRDDVVELRDFKACAQIRIDEIRRLFHYLDDPEETGDFWAVFADLKAEIYADFGSEP